MAFELSIVLTHMKLSLPGCCPPLLARKYKKQVFLSIDIPPAFMDLGLGPRTVLEIEKSANEIIRQVEGNTAPAGA